MKSRGGFSALLLAVFALPSACTSDPGIKDDSVAWHPLPVPEPIRIAGDPAQQVADVLLPDTDSWSGIFEYEVPEPALVASGFRCGLVVPPSPQTAAWRLAGVTPVYYTPILDIHAGREKLRPRNEPVYYHFRLSDDAR